MNYDSYPKSAQMAATASYLTQGLGGIGNGTISLASTKASGIQYDLDLLKSAVDLLRDTVLSLHGKVSPVSFPSPPTGSSANQTSAPKPSSSLVSDIISSIRADVNTITEMVSNTRNNLDL